MVSIQPGSAVLNQKNPRNQAQIVYFSHGGGPLPILGDVSHKAMVNFMLQLPSRLRNLTLSLSSVPIGKKKQRHC
jgi:hypothetical protein